MARYWPPRQRFWTHVRKTETCWLWTGHLNQSGYGRWRPVTNEGNKMAHRWAFETYVGPIPDGYEIDHLCGVHACVNPLHLRAVPARLNRSINRRGQRTIPIDTDASLSIYGHQPTLDYDGFNLG